MQAPTRTRDDAIRPTACPACGSIDVGTRAKSVDASTYWFCEKCGEVWNASRRLKESRYGFSRRS